MKTLYIHVPRICCLVLIQAGVMLAQLNGNAESYEICQTEACQESAKEILSGMDSDAEPCADFYNFVCRNWRNKYPDIPGIANRDQFTNVRVKLMEMMKATLERETEPSDSNGVNLARKLYRACVDQTRLDEQKAVLRAVLEEAGGWPIISPSIVYEDNTWRAADLYYIEYYATSWLYEISAQPSRFDPQQYILTLDLPTIVRPSFVDETEPNWREKYATFIRDTIKALVGPEKYNELDASTVAQDIEDIITLEKTMMRIYNRSDPLCSEYEYTTIAQLQFLYHGVSRLAKIDWIKRLQLLMNVAPDEPMQLSCPRQVEVLVAIMKRTANRAILNYIHWRIVARTLPLVDETLRNRFFAEDAHKPRWEKCIEENEALSAVLYEVIENHYPDDNDERALDVYSMVEALASWQFLSLKDKLKGNALTSAAYKLHENVPLYFKRPTGFFNETSFDRLFPAENVHRLYVENVLMGFAHRQTEAIRRLRDPIADKPANYPAVHDVHKIFAARFPEGRYIPAGLLQLPFYSNDRPQSLNYGALGTVIGKSVMKEFYEYLVAAYHGDRRIGQRMSETAREALVDNGRRVLSYWDAYALKIKPTKRVVRSDDLYEVYDHVAARDALRVAFQGYKREAKLRRWPDVRLPGLERYNPDQLFFLAYANAHCSAPSRLGLASTEEVSDAMLAEQDSLARRQVLLSLISSEYFGETFYCGNGTLMHPFQQHSLW